MLNILAERTILGVSIVTVYKNREDILKELLPTFSNNKQ